MRVFVAGDVVGAAGVAAIESWLPRLRQAWAVDVAIVNGENAAFEGKGMTPRVVRRLIDAGADVVTGGNHSLRCREIAPVFAEEPRLIMPINQPERLGRGWHRFVTARGVPVVVAQVQGQAMMPGKCTSPFVALDLVLAGAQDAVVLIDVHAEASSEKQALGWFVAGRAAALWGTHTHVPTADARLLSDHTAYQTDIGMCGPYDSVIGFDADAAIARFCQQDSSPLDVARPSDVRVSGAIIDIDDASRRAIRIVPVQLATRAPSHGDLPAIAA